MVESSTRKGSLDSAIKNAKLADVRGLLAVHPTIRRVCFATGSGSADIFRKGHREWLREPGAFSVGADDESQAVFAKHVAPPAVGGADAVGWQPVELVVMESVSPAFVPRQAHAASKQVAKGHDDAWPWVECAGTRACSGLFCLHGESRAHSVRIDPNYWQ